MLGAICHPSFPGSQPCDVPVPFCHMPSGTTAHSPRPVFFRSPGAVVRPLPHSLPGPVPFSHLSFRVSTPAGRQQPGGASPQDLHQPGTVSCALHGLLLSCPLVLRWSLFYWTCGGPFLLAPPPFPIPLPLPIPQRDACIPCVFSTLPLATLCHLPAAPFLVLCTDCSYPFSRCLFALFCVPSGGALWFFFGVCLFFFCTPWATSPPCSLCPSSLHARTSSLHWSLGHGSPLCSSLVLSPTRGVPLGGPRPSQVGAPPSRHSPLFPLSSPLPSLPPLPVPGPPSYCCSPAPCAPRCSSPRQGCISRALTRLHACRPAGRLGRPPQVPLWGDSPVVRPRWPPLHQFPDGGAGRPGRLNADHRHGVTLSAMSCTFVPLLATCVPLSPRGPAPRVRLLFPCLPLLSRSSPLTRALHVFLAYLCATPALLL